MVFQNRFSIAQEIKGGVKPFEDLITSDETQMWPILNQFFS